MSAPGCFAAASVFSHDSDLCRQCPAFVECSEASLKTLASIKNIINVDDLLKRHEKARQSSQRQIKAADDKAAAERPPGNIPKPLTKPVERQTKVEQVKFELTANDEEIIVKLPVKAQKVAISLHKSGFIARIRKDLSEGRNTFEKVGPGFIREALAMLLGSGFTRSGLKERLVEQLGWGDTTAASHVSQIIPIMTNFNMAKELADGQIVIHPLLDGKAQ